MHGGGGYLKGNADISYIRLVIGQVYALQTCFKYVIKQSSLCEEIGDMPTASPDPMFVMWEGVKPLAQSSAEQPDY